MVTGHTMSTATWPKGRKTTDGHELIANRRSTMPHTQENLQAGARVGGDHRHMAAVESADIHGDMIGNDGERQV